jgi:hypothetical protein
MQACIRYMHYKHTQIYNTNQLALLFNIFWFDYRFSGSYRKHVMVVPVPPGKRCNNALKVLTTASFNIILTSAFIYNGRFNTLLPTALYTYIHTHTHVCVCMYVCMCVCVYIYVCIYIYVYMYIYIYVYMYVCVCIYIYIYRRNVRM